MAVLIGIDEAGYGPVLGPLTVSSTAFMLPDEMLRKDLWEVLRRSVSKEKRSLKGRLLIADSKKAYNRKEGLGHLERTSLASLKSMDIVPAHLSGLINAVAPESLVRLGRYRWYKELEKISISPSCGDLGIASSAFKRDCLDNGISLTAIRSELYDVGYYNELISKVQNKASVLFTAVCKHIDWAFRHFGDQNLQIIVDRQGGRSHYLPVLCKMFPQAQGRIIREDDSDCSYELIDGNRKMRIHFVVKADDKSLPVSLASIVSKYLREVMMARVNAYFMELDPELAPTAGYWKDGNRFIDDLGKLEAAAIKTAQQTLEKGDAEVYSFGHIIHNTDVVQKLSEKGLNTVDSLDEVENGTILIRSHGATKKQIKEIRDRGLDIVDATCVLVKKVQNIASRLEREGYTVVVIGDSDHPEVRAITGSIENAIVIAGKEDLPHLEKCRKLGIVCQTTQSYSHFAETVSEIIKGGFTELKIINTLCREAIKRQDSAMELAKKVDIMFVLGGKHSANTKKLAELCKMFNINTFHLQNWKELDTAVLAGKKTAGVTAGASTPDWVIEEFVNKLRDIEN
jgi:4-hydroxy-3-methylbut-2-enyl diphosphate reductase